MAAFAQKEHAIETAYYATLPTGYREPVISKSGFGSIPAKTIIEVFKSTVEKHGSRNALALKRPVQGVIPSEWQFWTWSSYWKDCMSFAKTLVHLNVKPFSIINILGFNSPEWLIANNGAILAGCIAAGIYATNSPDACHYITEHSKCEVLAVDNNKQLAKYAMKGTMPELPHLKAIILWEEEPDPKLVEKCAFPVYTWAKFLELGKDVAEDKVTERHPQIKPGHCSTLIYTSGTTGPPKAVMISHDNVTWTTRNMCENFDLDLGCNERLCSFLPLSHIAAQLIDIHVPLLLGACTYFCQPDALKGTLTVTMKDCKPTVFFGVPRVWEKIQEKMVQVGRTSTGLKKAIATWAKNVGSAKTAASQYSNANRGQTQNMSLPWGYGCAKSIVFKNVRAALGLDECKACFTAAAPIAPETLLYFGSLDIPVYEVFGQSECTGPHTVSAPKQWRIGYCGRPMPGTESIIAPGTQELCYRGRHIFMGYMYMPDKTAETIDSEGFLHSGDVSEFDEHAQEGMQGPSGFMKITGRIKELIITAGGENVPPVLIENEMKAEMVALSNCMVVGDKRKYLSMLVSLKTTVDADGIPTDILAPDSLFVGTQIGSTAKTTQEAAACPLWKKYLDEGMKKANKRTTSNAQIVQKWRLLPTDFSEKAGELTPTLKLKRNVAAEKYSALIDSIYAEDEA